MHDFLVSQISQRSESSCSTTIVKVGEEGWKVDSGGFDLRAQNWLPLVAWDGKAELLSQKDSHG